MLGLLDENRGIINGPFWRWAPYVVSTNGDTGLKADLWISEKVSIFRTAERGMHDAVVESLR